MVLGLYGTLSLLVLALVLGPLVADWPDRAERRSEWLFLGLVVLLSPITLPAVAWHRGRQGWARLSAVTHKLKAQGKCR